MTSTAIILGDLLRAALDDCRVQLPALAERRVIDRMTELADIAGIELVVDTNPRNPTQTEERTQ